VSVTPTLAPSISSSALATPSVTPTVTPSITTTPSISVSVTPTLTPSISSSVLATPSVTPTVTPSITTTPSISVSVTPTLTPSITPSITPSASVASDTFYLLAENNDRLTTESGDYIDYLESYYVIADIETESNILSSTPNNPTNYAAIKYGSDTQNTYIYYGENWFIWNNN